MNELIERKATIDAIDVLRQEHRYRIPGKRETYSEYNEAWQDALDGAEGLIFNLPPIQPEPTDIDAKEAVYNLAEKIGIHQLFALTVELRGEPIQPELTYEQVEEYCKKRCLHIVTDDFFHTAQPEPHEGRFERKRDGVFCSVCHYGWEFITGVPAEVEREYHYCPNCGADMRGEQDG